MTLRTKILLLSSIAFLVFFVFGVTESGQKLLTGTPPANIDRWQADDLAMGAGLTPIVYGLIPFVLLLLSGLISWFIDRRRKSN